MVRGIVHLEMKILLSFTHPQDVLKNVCNQTVNTMAVNGVHQLSGYPHSSKQQKNERFEETT